MIFFGLPMFNEEKDIESYLNKVRNEMSKHKLKYKVIIFDDGSTDNSVVIVKKLSKVMPIQLFHHKKNRGLGVTMNDLFKQIATLTSEYDIVVTMDSDNSHDPSYVKGAVSLLKSGGYDLVILSRYVKGAKTFGLSFRRRFLSRCLALLLKLFFPIKGVKDYATGYRVYTASILKLGLNKYGTSFVEATGFAGMAEVLLKLRCTKNLRVKEIPLVLRYDLKVGDSKLRLGETIFEYFKVIMRGINA